MKRYSNIKIAFLGSVIIGTKVAVFVGARDSPVASELERGIASSPDRFEERIPLANFARSVTIVPNPLKVIG